MQAGNVIGMFCDLGKARVYYESYGEGVPVLMIHGFYPDHRLMKGCMEPIFSSRPGWRRIYFDLPGMALNGLLTGAAGQINGTTRAGHSVDRVGVGTGVYSLGAPRQIEFGLRVTF